MTNYNFTYTSDTNNSRIFGVDSISYSGETYAGGVYFTQVGSSATIGYSQLSNEALNNAINDLVDQQWTHIKVVGGYHKIYPKKLYKTILENTPNNKHDYWQYYVNDGVPRRKSLSSIILNL